jgi:hypothetical protein
VGRLFKDYTGRVFGVLKFIDHSGPKNTAVYLCRCLCGGKREVCGPHLVSGIVRTCGCGDKNRKWEDSELTYLAENYGKQPIHETGKVLKRSLAAIRGKVHELGLKSYIYSKKICDAPECFREVGARQKFCSKHRQREYRSSERVRENYRKYAASHRKTYKGCFSALRGEVKRRRADIFIDLSFDDYVSLWKNFQGLCYYCNTPIRHGGPCLDRLDNSTGYTVDNCVLCCVCCNRVRGELLTPEETKEVIFFLKNLRKTEDVWADMYVSDEGD